MKFGTNFVIFILFFGLSVLDAFQNKDLIRAAFWFAIGLVFLWADNKK